MPIQFRKFLNFLKLYFAFAIFLGAVFSTFSTLDYGLSSDGRDLLGIYLSIAFSLIIIILLVRWYIKGRNKLRALDPARKEDILISPFAFHFPKLVDFFDQVSLRGLTNKFYTYHAERYDGSIEAIKWLKLLIFPITPLSQERIKVTKPHDQLSNTGYMSKSKIAYETIEKMPINYTLVRKTYGFYYGCIFPLMFAPIPISIIADTEIQIHFPGAQFWWLILAYFTWGVLLIFISERWSSNMFRKKSSRNR